MKKLLFLQLWVCLVVSATYAQNSRVEQLKANFETAKEDTAKVRLYWELADLYLNNKPDTSLLIVEEGLNLAKKLSFSEGIVRLKNVLGNYYERKSEYPKALKEYQEAANLSYENNFTQGLAIVLSNQGIVYMRTGKIDRAIKLFFEALKAEEQLENTHGVAQSYHNIGTAYYYLQDMPKTIEYLKKALTIEEDLGNIEMIKKGYNNIGAIHEYLGEYDEALVFYEKALVLSEELKDSAEIAINLNNIASIYNETGSFDKAKQIYDRALIIKKKRGDKRGEAYVYVNLGELYRKQSDFESSKQYLLKAKSIAEEIRAREVLIETNKELAELSMIKKDADAVLEFMTEYSNQKDSLLSDEKNKAIADAETRYQTEVKEKENAELRIITAEQELTIAKEKNRALLFGGIAGLLLLGGGFGYRIVKLKQKNKLAAEMERQQKIRFKAVIDAEEQERVRVARELHDGLGQLLSTARLNVASLEGDQQGKEEEQILQSSLELIDNSIVEVRSISHNMMPLALVKKGLIEAIRDMCSRVSESGTLKVSLEEEGDFSALNQDVTISLYRVVQEILNNSIRHSGATEITVKIWKKGDSVGIVIQDNGKGFDTSKIKDSNGIGWKNIFSRLDMINGDINIDSSPGLGSRFSVLIK